MIAIIFLVILVLAAVVALRAAIVVFSRWMPKDLRVIYCACVPIAAIAAYYTTFHFSYYANANTRIFGWPIPTVIFQRHDASSPWLDFVRPTIILSYPLNLLLFISLPSIIVIFLARRSRAAAISLV